MVTKRILMGSLVQIDLGQEFFCYGQVLEKAEIAFFNYFGPPKSKELLHEIYSCPVLFILPVMNSAIKSGRWPVVHRTKVSEGLQRPRNYFIQDKLTNEFSIYKSDTGSSRPATRAEIDGLERAAVWSAEHVEDRLRDYHAGRPNAQTERLRPVP